MHDCVVEPIVRSAPHSTIVQTPIAGERTGRHGMAKAIQERDGLTVGFAKLLQVGQGPQARRGSVKQTVHDGDTVTVEADGNLGVRFLGVDAPETSIPLPGSNPDRPVFTKLSDPRWE
jgi:endonuclease YncB( thermonuclease family)